MTNYQHIEGVWTRGDHHFPYTAHIPVEHLGPIESRILDAGVSIEINHEALEPRTRAFLHAHPEREDEMCMDIATAACHAYNVQRLKGQALS